MGNLKSISSVIITTLLVFTGCGSDDTNGAEDSQEVFSGTQITIDATAGGVFAAASDPNNKYTYFDFSQNVELNLTDDEAKTDTDWDIAFKRTNVILNGGSSGDGDVTGAVADLQSELYDENGNRIAEKILLLDDEKGLVEFNKADNNVTTFIEDSAGSAIQTEWWRDFDRTNMTISANDDNWMIIKSSTGDSYAKMHATVVKSVNRKLNSLQLEMYVQGVGEDLFADTTQSIDINFTDEVITKYYDFDTNTLVEENEQWDLKIDNDFTIWLNSKIYGNGKGGAFGRTPGRTLEQTNSMIKTGVGSDGTDSGTNIPLFYVDQAAGIFSEYPWSEFKVDGGRKFWPLYRTYIVKVSDSEKYKVQLTNYYNEAGVSGYITMRYEALTD